MWASCGASYDSKSQKSPQAGRTTRYVCATLKQEYLLVGLGKVLVNPTWQLS